MINDPFLEKPSDNLCFEDNLYEKSIRIINRIPNLRFKDLGYDLLAHWCQGNILSPRYDFLYSEQWSIFLHAFQQFEKEQLSKKSLIHFMLLIELARYWESHLCDINSDVVRGGWPEEIEIFQFEKWIVQITTDDPWKYSLNPIRIDYDSKGKMITK
jgi:hypothetical protein